MSREAAFRLNFMAAGFGSTEISAGGLDAHLRIYEPAALGGSGSNKLRQEWETGRAAMSERTGLSPMRWR
jgi:hypothetical protein